MPGDVDSEHRKVFQAVLQGLTRAAMCEVDAVLAFVESTRLLFESPALRRVDILEGMWHYSRFSLD